MERLIIDFLLNFMTVEQINALMRDPQTVAIIVGSLVSFSGALLGAFLLLRRMALTSDAISHTVLLGIVVAFLLMTGVLGMDADLSSPLLIVGAAAAGVATVVLTELINQSGLVKQDAALGLVFPLLFAIAVILISSVVDKIHLDEDVVLVGEIGIAWADAESVCYQNCESVTITPDDPRAEIGRQCINCGTDGITPRSADAVFETFCANCGTFSAPEAWSLGLTDTQPTIVSFPRSIGVMGTISLLVALFVLLFYKELQITTFDPALAAALGFRPSLIHYALMVLVSLTAVGAFDAVGSILVVAFFIIPPAAAYLLTDRLWVMLVLAPIIGIAGVVSGYDFARGSFFGVLDVNDFLLWLDRTIGIGGFTEWNVSISASMVMMTFVLFVFAWILSPRYGLLSTMLRRLNQQRLFAEQMLLAHIFNHQGTAEAEIELATPTLHEHLGWSRNRVRQVLTRLRLQDLVQVVNDQVRLTSRGQERITSFEQRNLIRTGGGD